jgi:hypothetical protein
VSFLSSSLNASATGAGRTSATGKAAAACPHEFIGTENFEKEFTGLDVASAFEVLEPLSPHSNAIFVNFSTEPTIRCLRPKERKKQIEERDDCAHQEMRREEERRAALSGLTLDGGSRKNLGASAA